ncbi:hypothetical protein [Pantoea sp. 18069]|uniref:hypothetical protein n=1 Tax=Pantoea sp. 18069 TaxID=2681415 RepID=UPI00135C8EB5|nr:hypothetical protein [Pantoea sp. 18069]
MSDVLEKNGTATSASIQVDATHVAKQHEDIDRHVAVIAKQVDLLIEPIMTAWPMPGSFPGQDQLVEADDLLSHLVDPATEWDQDRPKPSAGELIAEVQGWLEQAIEAIDTRDALEGHDARRLLTREALTRTKAASFRCIDSHARVEREAAKEFVRGAAPSAPAAPAETPDAADQLIAQHAKVFGGIALQASILLRLVDGACASTDSGELMGAMDAIRIIVASIGSLADGFNGEDQRGNQYGWHLSENISGGAHE